jgi:hypothetical protein
MDLGCSLAYQFSIAPSSDMMNDLAMVVLLPPDEIIVAS